VIFEFLKGAEMHIAFVMTIGGMIFLLREMARRLRPSWWIKYSGKRLRRKGQKMHTRFNAVA